MGVCRVGGGCLRWGYAVSRWCSVWVSAVDNEGDEMKVVTECRGGVEGI